MKKSKLATIPSEKNSIRNSWKNLLASALFYKISDQNFVKKSKLATIPSEKKIPLGILEKFCCHLLFFTKFLSESWKPKWDKEKEREEAFNRSSHICIHNSQHNQIFFVHISNSYSSLIRLPWHALRIKIKIWTRGKKVFRWFVAWKLENFDFFLEATQGCVVSYGYLCATFC